MTSPVPAPVLALSPTLGVADMAAARTFYERHLGAVAVFDCGWYVVLRLGTDGSPELCLKTAAGDEPAFAGGGLTFNLRVSDVDGWHRRLVEDGGLAALMPLADHPWGDRGFAVADPLGVTLYVYTPIPPTAEFQAFLTGA